MFSGESEILKFQGSGLDSDSNRQHLSSARRPYFKSSGKTYRIRNGYTVTLECFIENIGKQNTTVEKFALLFVSFILQLFLCFLSGSSVIVWKQTDRIISAGEVLLRKDARMSLIKSSNGINLQLANVTPDDRGKINNELCLAAF